MNNSNAGLRSARLPAVRGSRFLAGVIAAWLSATASGQSVAVDPPDGTVDSFSPYAAVRVAYDSNIYRLDDDARSIGERADQYLMLSVGANSEFESSQQRYQFAAEINQSLFDNHDDLDYTGGKGLALWRWVVSDAATGKLSYEYHRTLRDFANQPALERVKDIRTVHEILGNADFNLPGAWRTGVRANVADISYSTSDRLDLTRSTIGVNGGYASTAGSVIGVDAEIVMGRYDRNKNADFDEYTVGPTLDWRPTEQSQLEARVGYTKRDNSVKTRNDFDAITGEVVYAFDDKAGRKVEIRLWRDISTLGDEISEYALVDGLSVEPKWQLSGSLDLRVRAAYETRDFKATAERTDRNDDVGSGGAYVDWNPRRNFTLTVGGDMQTRSSNRRLEDYDFGRAQLQFTARF